MASLSVPILQYERMFLKKEQNVAPGAVEFACPSDAEQPGTPTRDNTLTASSHFTVTASGDSSDDYGQESPVPSPAAAAAAMAQLQQKFNNLCVARQQQQQQQLVAWPSSAHTAAVAVACLFWIAASSATILINKHILVDLSFHFPGAVAALGMLGTAVTSFLVCAVFRLVPCQASVSPYFFFTRIMTTGFFMALSFQAGNTAYLYLTVAFVQMLKAFTPVTTMLCGFMFGLERASAKLIAAVSCICLGVVVSSYGEVNFSWFGVVAMLTSVGSEGLRLVMMQHLLAAKQFHPLEAWMYLAPACTIWLVLLIGVFEIHHINDQHGLDIIVQHHWYFVFAALAGFAVNTLAMLVIKLASALTLKVLGICKDIGLVMAGVMLLGEHVTMLQVAGYSVSLLGCSCYNYIKAMGIGSQQLQVQQETCQNKQQQQQQGGKLGDSNKSHRSSSSSRLKHGLIGRAPMRSTGLQDPLLPKAMPPPPPNSKAHS